MTTPKRYVWPQVNAATEERGTWPARRYPAGASARTSVAPATRASTTPPSPRQPAPASSSWRTSEERLATATSWGDASSFLPETRFALWSSPWDIGPGCPSVSPLSHCDHNLLFHLLLFLQVDGDRSLRGGVLRHRHHGQHGGRHRGGQGDDLQDHWI